MKRLILGDMYAPPKHNRTLTDAFHNRGAAAAALCAVITNWRRVAEEEPLVSTGSTGRQFGRRGKRVHKFKTQELNEAECESNTSR